MSKKRSRKKFDSDKEENENKKNEDGNDDNNEREIEEIVIAECISILTDELIESKTKNGLDFQMQRDCSDSFGDRQLNYSLNPKWYEICAKYSKNESSQTAPFEVAILIKLEQEKTDNMKEKSDVEDKHDCGFLCRGSCSCLPDFYWCDHIAQLASIFQSNYETFKTNNNDNNNDNNNSDSDGSSNENKNKNKSKENDEPLAKKRRKETKYVYIVMYQKDFLESESDTRYPQYFDSEIKAIFENLDDANKYAKNFCNNEFSVDFQDLKEKDYLTEDGRFFCSNEETQRSLFSYQEFVYVDIKKLL